MRVDRAGDTCDSRGGKKITQCDRRTRRGSEALKDTRRKQRMTTEGKEISVAAGSRHAEHVLEHRGNESLGVGGRRIVAQRFRTDRRRQRATVELSVRRLRQDIDAADERRLHRVRQMFAQQPPHGVHVPRIAGARNDPQHEPVVAVRDALDCRGGIGHRGMPTCDSLHFAKFDAVTPNLDLPVNTSFEDEVTA